jgi:hypothetical protein
MTSDGVDVKTPLSPERTVLIGHLILNLPVVCILCSGFALGFVFGGGVWAMICAPVGRDTSLVVVVTGCAPLEGVGEASGKSDRMPQFQLNRGPGKG